MPSIKERMAAFGKKLSPKTKKGKAATPGKLPKATGLAPTPAATPEQPSPAKMAAKAPAPVAMAKPSTPAKTSAAPAKAIPAGASPSKLPSGDEDWKYLNELAEQFDQWKLQEAEEKKASANAPKPVQTESLKEQASKPKTPKEMKAALEGVLGDNFTANGSFLNNEFITKHLVENKKFKSLTFDYCGQSKLFKRFDKTEKNRPAIIAKFVDTLVNHPRANEITQINMANTLMPDEFLEALSDKCIQNPKYLSKLQILNLETNLLSEPGLVALSKAIGDPKVWRYLQVLKLENQKKDFPSTAEDALAEAIVKSQSIVACSLIVRGGLARQQINNTVAHNIDRLRQARRQHQAATGTLKERKRTEMEQYFDKIAANDASITDVDLVGNQRFLSLKKDEKTKSGAAFANNTHVKNVKMVKLGLDDSFAKALGEALATNTTIEKLIIDSNDISGEGIKALFEGLGKNSTIVEFQVRHQSKKSSTSDEEALPPLLDANKTIIKLGVDVRNQMAKMQLDRKTNENREHQRKMRAQAKKAG